MFWLLPGVFLFFGFLCGYNQTCQSDKGGYIRNNHELIEHVGKLPYQVVWKAWAEENKGYSDNLVNSYSLLSEEVININLAKYIPAEDCRECEE